MFQVEVPIFDDVVLSERMGQLLTWLDQRRFEPTTFRYAFLPDGMICRVDFPIVTEAEAFAAAFEGRLVNGWQLEPIG